MYKEAKNNDKRYRMEAHKCNKEEPMLPKRSKVVKYPKSKDLTKYWICPMCGFFSPNKTEVFVHMGDNHTYSEAEMFGYEYIYSLYSLERTKRIVQFRCENTQEFVPLSEIHTHECPLSHPKQNDHTRI